VLTWNLGEMAKKRKTGGRTKLSYNHVQVLVVCRGCGCFFVASRGDAKTCSDGCRGLLSRERRSHLTTEITVRLGSARSRGDAMS
jgi:predicted nucleic acid-binding Zn ribbon protein